MEEFYEKELRKDPMTNIPNSRALKEHFVGLLEGDKNDFSPTSFVLLDIDGFGDLNSAFGKSRCDSFIQDIAPYLEKQMRRSENAFRIHSASDSEMKIATTSISGMVLT